MKPIAKLWAVLFMVGWAAVAAAAEKNAVVAGEFIVEPPTLMNLGFEWKIQGDDNHSATVAVQYFFSRTHTRASWDQAVAPTGTSHGS